MIRILLVIVASCCFFTPANGGCAAPNDVCAHIRYCAIGNLTPKNEVDRNRLNSAIDREDGNEIYSATEACQRNVGDIRQWNLQSAGCTTFEYQRIGVGLKKAGWTCGKRVDYFCHTQGSYWHIDDLQCRGPKRQGAACLCNIYGQQSPGTVEVSVID